MTQLETTPSRVYLVGALAGLLAISPAALCVAQTNPTVVPQFDWGLLASKDTTADGNLRFRALGPIFETQTATNGAEYSGFRPFYGAVTQPRDERSLAEFLWPVGMRKKSHNETYWRFLSAFGHNFEVTNPDSRRRLIVFPFVFSGRDKDGEGYFAVFPIGGKINEFLLQDKIEFALFPLYTHSAVNTLETYDILWPFVSWSHGDTKSKFRILPFYAKSVNEGKWVKKSVMWPIWSSAEYMYPDEKGGGFLLFPLCGHTKLTGQESWTALWPFFRWSKGEKIEEVHCPWPFFQYSSGETEKLYFWPLWGKKEKKGVASWFALAKLVGGEKIDRGDSEVSRFTVFPLFFNESRSRKPQPESAQAAPVPASSLPSKAGDQSPTAKAAPEKTAAGDPVFVRYFKLWPILSYQRESGVSKWKALDLWPTKGMASVERNLAPFWTLYSRESAASMKEDEALWGLFRYRRDAGGGKYVSVFPLFSYGTSGADNMVREWSFLKGLIGYRREGNSEKSNGLRKELRALYFPIRYQKKTSDAEPREVAP